MSATYGLDVALSAYLWLWFINLTNFMDGIDGITGVESGSIGVGILVAAPLMIVGASELGILVSTSTGLYAVALAAAAAGFLYWNWQPAKIFLGDVGAVPLGFLLGWLLLETAGAGLWPVAILLPLYYWADATITLVRRALRREPLFQAHRSHFYQTAAQRMGSHAPVVLAVLALNAALVALAYVTAWRPELTALSLIAGGAVTVALLWYFGRGGARAERAPPGNQP